MILQKKTRFKPLYKKFLKVRENVQNRKKVLGFKKLKWEQFIKNYQQKQKPYKKYKTQDQGRYIVSKYPSRTTSYGKKHKIFLNTNRKIKIYYGNLLGSCITRGVEQLKKVRSKEKDLKLVILESFEKRLDVVLYRSKFSASIEQSKQLIIHGKVLVNLQKVRKKSYILKKGDVVSIDLSYLKLVKFNMKQCQLWPIPPKYLVINYRTMELIFGDFLGANLSPNFLFNFNLEQIIKRFFSSSEVEQMAVNYSAVGSNPTWRENYPFTYNYGAV